MRRYIAYFVLLTLMCASFAPADDASQVALPAVQLNTVGYLPASPKLGTSLTEVDKFVVRDIKTGREVMHGNATLAISATTAEPLYELDFSSVAQEGNYRIESPGRNPTEFRVAADTYNWPFYCVTRAMYLARCGDEVSATFGGKRFEHGRCHLKDANLDFVGGTAGAKKDGCGGWHDAGDYNKYTVNAAFTLGMMLTAWEDFQPTLRELKLDIPESSNQTPDFLDEARWELEWLLKMQADDGSVYHKLSTLRYGGFISPEKEAEPRYFSPWSSAATATFAAIMARAARVYQEFDKPFANRCLSAAKKSYEFLQAHPDDHRPDLSAFEIRSYVAPDPDDRLWAAAEIWETTGDKSALQDCEARLTVNRTNTGPASVTVDADWDWSNVRNLATFTYLRSKRADRDPAIAARVKKETLRVADGIVDSARRHPYGRPLGNTYYWGCNGTVARQAINLNVAYQLTNDQRYRDTMLDALNHLFGRNPFARSYVTGLGDRPPLFPHDRRSGGDGIDSPWPGYLVGGPWPGANDWGDKQESYRTNEIAINWNGALIYALAAFVEPATFDASIRRERERTNSSSN